MKSRYVEYGGKLLIVCAVCMLGVGGAYVMARNRIEEGKKAALLGSLKQVLMLPADAAPPAVHPATKDLAEDRKVYFADSPEYGKLYAAQGGQQGYSSVVKVAVGARTVSDGELEIVAVRVVSQAETPGLGTRIAELSTNLNFWTWLGNMFGAGVEERTKYAYLEQYAGKRFSGADLEGIAIMTGVTISSNAVTEAVVRALKKIREVAGGGS